MLDSTTPNHPPVSLDKPVPPTPSMPDGAAQPRELTLRFTGSGSEYFRIWIVNLMLTVVTLGIYSAWAKVRRLQYFDRNTELDGAVFDFTGNPWAILRGRIVAIALLALYQFSVGFSVTAGIIVAVILLAALPMLIRGALRFRMANTRYRGLRFAFTGSARDAYIAWLPPMAALFLPAALVAVAPKALGLVTLAYILWPFMHCAMKRYQHGNVRFASLQSRADLDPGQFYVPYAIMFGLMLGTILVGITIMAIVGVLIFGGFSGLESIGAAGAVVAVVVLYGLLLAAGLFVFVRTTNLAWSGTSFPGMTIRSSIPLKGFIKLQAVNVLLTLVTLGLFRPFAVVRTHRFRLEHMSLVADDTLERAMAEESAHPTSASGDGVADFFDLDVSW